MSLSSRLFQAKILVVIPWHVIGSLLWKAPIVDPYKELRQLQYEILLGEQSTGQGSDWAAAHNSRL